VVLLADQSLARLETTWQPHCTLSRTYGIRLHMPCSGHLQEMLQTPWHNGRSTSHNNLPFHRQRQKLPFDSIDRNEKKADVNDLFRVSIHIGLFHNEVLTLPACYLLNLTNFAARMMSSPIRMSSLPNFAEQRGDDAQDRPTGP